MDDEPEKLQNMNKSICFEVAEELRKAKGPWFISGLLKDVCQVRAEDVFCFQTFRAEGKYDVHLHEKAVCTRALERLQEAASTEALRGVDISLGSVRREVPVTVHLANPLCGEEAVAAFLRAYCDQVGPGETLRNGLGLWNGQMRFGVLLKLDDEGRIGNTLHPPAEFYLGNTRGTLAYPRQPKYCAICLTSGHSKAQCDDPPCKHCGDKGHDEQDCLFNHRKHPDGWDGQDSDEYDSEGWVG